MAMTESQWADIEKNWREWFPDEELPLGGKANIWALSYTHKFQIAFMFHDIHCKSATQPAFTDWPFERVDKLFYEMLRVLAEYDIFWKDKLIRKMGASRHIYYEAQRDLFKFLVESYRSSNE